MSNGLIGIDIQGIDKVQKMLDNLVSPPIADEAAEAVGKYLVDVLKTYPPQTSVTRADAYSEVGGWFSERQRRWFFAALNNGEIDTPYRRTQTLRNSWQVIGQGATAIIVNETDYAIYVMGDSQGAEQSRMAGKIGWERIPVILQERQSRIQEIIDGLVKRRIKSAS